MIFQDNAIQQYLKNVYFISGTPCGGKTTVSKALGELCSIQVYDIDKHFPIHQSMSDHRHQPSMNRSFKNADEFFGRSVEEYTEWLIGNTREQLDYVLLDLIRLSSMGPIICDCHLNVEEARQISDTSRVVFLIKEPVNLVDEYCNRSDHQGFSRFIHSASDFDRAKETCNETLRRLNMPRYQAIRASEFLWLERNHARSVEETVQLVGRHLGLISK